MITQMRVRQVGRIALPPSTPPILNAVMSSKVVRFEAVFQPIVAWNISEKRSGKISKMPFEDGVRAVTQSVTLWLVATT